LAVADAHGYLEDDIMRKVALLFDCLIIHTDQEASKNQKLNDLLIYLNQQKK
jgi:acyl dehydratase